MRYDMMIMPSGGYNMILNMDGSWIDVLFGKVKMTSLTLSGTEGRERSGPEHLERIYLYTNHHIANNNVRNLFRVGRREKSVLLSRQSWTP